MDDGHKDDDTVVVKGSSGEKTLLIAVIIIVLALALLFFSFKFFVKKELPKTIDDLHLLNLEGKLDPDHGYMYAGYSFVNLGGVWYTQIMSPKRSRLYDAAFRFDPKQVKDIPIYGKFNVTSFDAAKTYYVTFDPLGSQFQYVALAVGDFNNNMLKIFEKKPIAACDKNETDACKTRPIINCSNTKDIVLYIKERNKTAVILEDNCIIIQGNGFNIIKAVDKLLYTLYKIQE